MKVTINLKLWRIPGLLLQYYQICILESFENVFAIPNFEINFAYS